MRNGEVQQYGSPQQIYDIVKDNQDFLTDNEDFNTKPQNLMASLEQ